MTWGLGKLSSSSLWLWPIILMDNQCSLRNRQLTRFVIFWFSIAWLSYASGISATTPIYTWSCNMCRNHRLPEVFIPDMPTNLTWVQLRRHAWGPLGMLAYIVKVFHYEHHLQYNSWGNTIIILKGSGQKRPLGYRFLLFPKNHGDIFARSPSIIASNHIAGLPMAHENQL